MQTLLRLLVIASLTIGATLSRADANDASVVLLSQYHALQGKLDRSPFQKPLYLESSETSASVTGEAYALLDFPFATSGKALSGPSNWCDILMLHLNTKFCRPSLDGELTVLNVHIGKKHDQALADAYPVKFIYGVAAASPGYLKVVLTAAEGPLSTHDYRVSLEAIPVNGGQTFLHFTYSYAYGFAGRLAMQAYLGTIGSDKVGFTLTGQQANGIPLNINGLRGLAERNTMRYYLAIEAFLGALSSPPAARLEKRLHDWFAATERYPRQLHEMGQGEYLDMKRKEHLRART